MNRMVRAWGAALGLAAGLAGCVSEDRAARAPAPAIAQPSPASGRWARVKTTGYCACGACCSWQWTLLGGTVVSAGPNRGRPKDVGVTASGTRARPGVVAADTNLFAFGTIVFVPGYGYGRVEDLGGDIRGYHLDLFFPTHAEAQQWGVRPREIRFWRPQGRGTTPGYSLRRLVPRPD